MALRFYFSPQVKETIDKRVEYGARNELFVPSHQIDRGLFENDMVEMVSQLGVEIILGGKCNRCKSCQMKGIRSIIPREGLSKILTSNWVVDATGRAGLLKRKEGLRKEVSA